MFLMSYCYGLPDCPMYALLQVLHLSLYIRLGLLLAKLVNNNPRLGNRKGTKILESQILCVYNSNSSTYYGPLS